MARHQSPNKVCFAFLTRANWSSISYGIVFKLGEPGDGPLTLCTNCVGLGLAITITSTGSKLYLVKGSPKNLARWLKFGIFLGALPFGLLGLNAMTKCLIMNNGRNPRLSNGYGTNSFSMLKRHGTGWWNWSRLVVFRRKLLIQGFDKTWGARNVLYRRHNMSIEWNWKRLHW